MKLIFLDIDGTMIPLGSGHSFGRREPFPIVNSNAFNELMSSVDLENTSIILSSCWGNQFENTTQLQYWLGESGIEYSHQVMGKTRHYGNRTESILLYLEMFTHNVCMPIDSILVLDDETIEDPLDVFSIKLDPKVGFTTDHIDEASRILNEVKFDYDAL